MNSSEHPKYNEPLPGDVVVEDANAPAVLLWYKAYCVLMALIFIAGAAAGGSLVLFHTQLPNEVAGTMSDSELSLRGIVLMIFCIVMFAVNVAALFLPRRPWAWVYHLINISLGLAPCCILTVPIMLLWLKPPLQEYFGYKPSV